MNFDTTAYLSNYLTTLLERCKSLTGLSDFATASPETVEDAVKQHFPAISRADYELFFQDGNRLHYEKLYFKRREFFTCFGLLLLLREDFAALNIDVSSCVDAACFVIEELLAEPTWVLPAHGSPAHYDGTAKSIDLFAAETAGSIGEVLGRLNLRTPRINACISRFLARCEADIFSVFEASCPCDWWETGTMNWNPVCMGNIGICAYYLHELAPENMTDVRYEAVRKRVLASLHLYIEEMERTGVCLEGVLYYQYGMEYFLSTYECLAENTKEADTFSFPKSARFLSAMSLGHDHYVNFSDCTPDTRLHLGLVAFLSHLYPGLPVPTDCSRFELLGGDECHRFSEALRNYLWVKNYSSALSAASKAPSFFHSDAAEWAVKRFDNGCCLYVKGGNNAEDHNHNDVGSFGYLAYGTPVFLELGSGEYTADYFGANRYDILCCSSEGHNVPLPDGRRQSAGKESRASHFHADEKMISIEYGQAYGYADGSLLRREITFEENGGLESGSFFLTDTFRSPEASSSLTENFVFPVAPEIKGNKLLLTFDKEIYPFTVTVTLPEDAVLTVTPKVHVAHDGRKETVFIVRAVLTQTAPRQELIFPTKISVTE